MLGGHHRVLRTGGGLFTEHGPRIYSDNYQNFRRLLHEMGLDFHDLFTPYKFSISSIGGRTFWDLTWREKFWMAVASLQFFLAPTARDTWKHITLAEFMAQHAFTAATRDYFDRLSRLTDGAGADQWL